MEQLGHSKHLLQLLLVVSQYQNLQGSMQELDEVLRIFDSETACGLTKPYYAPMDRPQCCQASEVEKNFCYF